MSRAKDTLQRIGHEMKINPPKQLARTAAKFGAEDAARQKTAILLSKARKAGARIPQKGGRKSSRGSGR